MPSRMPQIVDGYLWQDDITRQAKALDLDVIRLGADQVKFDVALIEWVAERRLRRRK